MRIRPVAPYAMLWELLHCGWMVVPLAVLTFDVRYDQVLLNGGAARSRSVSYVCHCASGRAVCFMHRRGRQNVGQSRGRRSAVPCRVVVEEFMGCVIVMRLS